jgi:two-component system NtrC family response regulator
MSLELPRMGHEVTVCPDGQTAISALERNSYDCLLLDLDMPGLGGLEVISWAKELCPDADSIILTGKSSLESAIAAVRHGVFDYLTKPCKLADIEKLLTRVAEKRRLTNKYRALKRQLERAEGQSQLVGDSAAMEQVRARIAKVAPTNSSVLIRGETGTGKELVARALHDQSLRADMPFVAINCGALPETLIESELFGHRKGAFTGAEQKRTGLFQVAHGGTLFLDEVGELPLAMQAKLLRVLESGEIRPLGENDSLLVDVRIICATHRALEGMVMSGEFREDLMFRVNTFEIQLPALRERRQDIAPLVHHLLDRLHFPSATPRLTDEALALLVQHDWPGNVRELANVVEHATILCDAAPILPEHLPGRLQCSVASATPQVARLPQLPLRDLEIMAIQQSLQRHQGNKPKAADELGVSLRTLYNKLNQTDSTRAA